jgi:hypothetical protein
MSENQMYPKNANGIQLVSGTIAIQYYSKDETMRAAMHKLHKIEEQTSVNKELKDLLEILETSLFELDDGLKSISLSTPEELKVLVEKVQRMVEMFESYPDWVPVSSLQDTTGLTVDAIRKQLQNPMFFEPGVDYKKSGRFWYIHKNAIARIRRKK